MEKFEFDGEKNPELFSGFVSRAKDSLATLIDNIKSNIKEYEQRIEDTTKEISDNELSREKCEHEITKMENKIEVIKDAIENVESTYKKIVDAYSSTSKGETKELYSEIIDGAKANCERDVEKNRSEIARLNSDIEAIKNNITEFSKIIDDLNRNLDNYNLELYKFNKTLEYMSKESERIGTDLEDMSSKKEIPSKKAETKAPIKKAEARKTTTSKAKELEEDKKKVIKASEVAKEEIKEEPKNPIDESLKQIYDLTGYNPARKEVKETKEEPAPVQEEKKEEKPIYSDNLDSLFSNTNNDVEDKGNTSFLDVDLSSWESILNAPNDEISETESNKEEVHDAEGTVDQLLSPYGTSFKRLKSLTTDKISYKDGRVLPFDMSVDDVIKAINTIDGTDLKKMKTVGPEITLLRKVKAMKEGNL